MASCTEVVSAKTFGGDAIEIKLEKIKAAVMPEVSAKLRAEGLVMELICTARDVVEVPSRDRCLCLISCRLFLHREWSGSSPFGQVTVQQERRRGLCRW